ncbi:MAG TPA: glycosyltransferase family 2 protein [Chloroflexia bacterium]|nr:glycosyltransferase family 2 protein [Chloroflexia bacterium]
MTPDQFPTATVVIVNYNTPAEVPGCLDALAALEYPDVEILLVDNGGDGGRPVDLGDRYPAVRVLHPARNLGFGGGANLGWEQARGEILAVVNPDVRVRPEWLRALATGLHDHADRRAAIGGGKLLYPDGRVQHAGGTFRFPAATTALIGRGEPDGVAFAHDQEMAYVTGGAFAITRAASAALGGFDAGFWPVYFEDVDLCTRAWDAGYSVWYLPAAVAVHAESASLAHGGADYFRYYQRNRLRYVLRHYPAARVRGEFAAAEESRLRGDLAPEDRVSSLNLYADLASLDAVQAPPAAAPPLLPGPAPGPAAARADRLAAATAEALAHWRVTPQPFRSRLPGVAWLRTRLNNLWTRWYVEPILAQQVAYNAVLARTVRELADQVAGLEAALLVRAGLAQLTDEGLGVGGWGLGTDEGSGVGGQGLGTDEGTDEGAGRGG